jgi:hypothetical protein
VRAAAVVLVLALTATIARADDDPLAVATRLEAQLDYEAALIIVEKAIAQGGADRHKLVTLHLFAGKLAAGLDRPAVAEDHFARALALAPTTKFSEGTSPKITEPFDRARGRSAELRITAEIKPNAIAIAPVVDPLGLVAGIAVTIVENAGGNARGIERELRAMQTRRIELPAGARATRVTALDAFGNRVWSEDIALQPGSTRVATHVDTTTHLRPLYARWPFWATTTVVALGAGGVCAWRFNSAQEDFNTRKMAGTADYSELQDIAARGRRWALAANISFGAAAASTLIAIITAARGSTTTAVVTAQSDSVGLAIGGRF